MYWLIHNVRILSNGAAGQAANEVLYVLHGMICRSVLKQSEQESEPSRKLFWRSNSSYCQMMRALWLHHLPTANCQVVGGLNKMDQLLLTLLPFAQLILTWPLAPAELHQVEENRSMELKCFSRTVAGVMICDVTSFHVWKSLLWREIPVKIMAYLAPFSSFVLLQEWYVQT